MMYLKCFQQNRSLKKFKPKKIYNYSISLFLNNRSLLMNGERAPLQIDMKMGKHLVKFFIKCVTNDTSIVFNLLQEKNLRRGRRMYSWNDDIEVYYDDFFP